MSYAVSFVLSVRSVLFISSFTLIFRQARRNSLNDSYTGAVAGSINKFPVHTLTLCHGLSQNPTSQRRRYRKKKIEPDRITRNNINRVQCINARKGILEKSSQARTETKRKTKTAVMNTATLQRISGCLP